MSSAIATIVDYTAATAARIAGLRLPNGSTVGVRSAYGAGQGVIADPLHPGQTITPAPEDPLEPFTHVSDLPEAPSVTQITQDGTYEIEWTVPMRLYVPRGDLRTARATLLPFYDAYLAAFAPDPQLDGLCLVSHISAFRRDNDDNWAWLEVELSVTEQVSY